jgi:TPR repeat protein
MAITSPRLALDCKLRGLLDREAVYKRREVGMSRALPTLCLTFGLVAVLGGCVPGTYYDPTDNYVRGLRLFDRGQPENAILFWKPLADAGDCDAQYRYGTLFFLGAGVPKNLDSAREWWTRAANQGQYRAQVMLATVYGHRSLTTGSFLRTFTVDCRQGCGVPRDPQLAYEWLRLAQNLVPSNSEAARQQAALEIAALEAELTPDQKADAERRISAWVPTPARCMPRELL